MDVQLEKEQPRPRFVDTLKTNFSFFGKSYLNESAPHYEVRNRLPTYQTHDNAAYNEKLWFCMHTMYTLHARFDFMEAIMSVVGIQFVPLYWHPVVTNTYDANANLKVYFAST